MRVIYRLGAETIFIFHLAVIGFVSFGWLFLEYKPLYFFVLLVVGISDLILGYCVLSKWEFNLRKKLNPELEYSHSFLVYYLFKFFPKQISDKFLATTFQIFVWSLFILNSIFSLHSFA